MQVEPKISSSGNTLRRPQNQLEDTLNRCLEAMASTLTKVNVLGVKLHIIEVAESEFCVIFNQFLQNKDLSCETMPRVLFCF